MAIKAGDQVQFKTSIRHDPKPGGQNTMAETWESGRIVKLHPRSGRQGAATIKTAGGRKVTRRMQHVKA